MMEERRASERVNMQLPGRIILDQTNPVSCTIRDRSEFGALLKVDSASSIPNAFELQIPATGETLQASVAWREAGTLGVMVE